MAQQTEPIKICTGCGRLNTEQPLGLNKNGEPYLACCPDNDYKLITAVEWLIKRYSDYGTLYYEDMTKAKAMEKEQNFRDFVAGQNSMEEGGKDFIQYFNKTYNKNEF